MHPTKVTGLGRIWSYILKEADSLFMVPRYFEEGAQRQELSE
jgi:hypothetical protein